LVRRNLLVLHLKGGGLFAKYYSEYLYLLKKIMNKNRSFQKSTYKYLGYFLFSDG